MRRLACIVEGYGEVEAVPILVRRLCALWQVEVGIEHPIRVPRSKLIKPEELERTVEIAARRVGNDGAILVLIDADEACPRALGPALLERARVQRGHMDIAVVLAKVEYEAWFIASIESLRGHRGIRADAHPPPDPEGITGAKGWISRQMQGRGSYRETEDQAALTAIFDLAKAAEQPSFDKLCRDVWRLMMGSDPLTATVVPPSRVRPS